MLHHTTRATSAEPVRFAYNIRDSPFATTPDLAQTLQKQRPSLISRQTVSAGLKRDHHHQLLQGAASHVYENGCDSGWRAGGCGRSNNVGPARLEGSGTLQRARGIDSAV